MSRARAREIIRLKTGGLFKLIGQYRDQLVREDGAWRFSRRDYDPIAEEAPGAYKDVEEVVEGAHAAGISAKVARLRPIACVKG